MAKAQKPKEAIGMVKLDGCRCRCGHTVLTYTTGMSGRLVGCGRRRAACRHGGLLTSHQYGSTVPCEIDRAATSRPRCIMPQVPPPG